MSYGTGRTYVLCFNEAQQHLFCCIDTVTTKVCTKYWSPNLGKKPLTFNSRYSTTDHWIQESIKQVVSFGLFWAVRAAEKKMETAICMLLLRSFFYVFTAKKNSKFFKKYCSVLTKKLRSIKVNFFFRNVCYFELK